MARPRAHDEPLPEDGDEASEARDRASPPPLRSSSISELARRHGLSRSTLLYYDRIGLLRPSDRTAAGYRRYSRDDEGRLERIGRYRKAGLALRVIHRLLEGGGADVADVLAARLAALNEEIHALREQQRFVVGLLGRRDVEALAFMSREKFVAMLKAGGFTASEMDRWHEAFERTAPEEHQRFLEFLCIPDREIRAIRSDSAVHGRSGGGGRGRGRGRSRARSPAG